MVGVVISFFPSKISIYTKALLFLFIRSKQVGYIDEKFKYNIALRPEHNYRRLDNHSFLETYQIKF